jgi:hypothetical protein
MSSSTERTVGEPTIHSADPGMQGADARTAPGKPGIPAGKHRPGVRNRPGNGLATASLVAGIAGITLVTIVPALVCGLLGLRRANREGLRGPGAGLVRCWVGIGLSVIWAAAGVYLLPHLVRAADPGCTAYKGAALTAYNKVIADLGGRNGNALAHASGAGAGANLTLDLSRAITALNVAAKQSSSAATSRDLSRLTMQLQTLLADIQDGAVVPDRALTALNRDTARTDTACGTLHI